MWAGEGTGNLWRTTGDITDKWDGKHGYSLGVMTIADQNEPLYSFAGPGHPNDPDMLEVGNGGMTADEYRAHFSPWAMMAAPLMAGNDAAHMRAETRSILTNKDVIAVDQDALGHAGRRVRKEGDVEVWSRELANGDRAVLLVNRGGAAASIHVSLAEVGLPDALTLRARDLWIGRELGAVHGGYTAESVASHGGVMLHLHP